MHYNIDNSNHLKKSAIIFKALSDETRLKIIDCLFDDEKTVNSIVEATEISQSGISHQLKLLKDLNILKNEKRGKFVYYSLADDHVKTIIEQTILHVKEGY